MTRLTPTAANERITDIDTLRGLALLGVFLSNLASFAGGSVMADGAHLATLPTARWDAIFGLGLGWLVDDKANTLLAFLFGVGFAIQQQRAMLQGNDGQLLLARRMLVLLAFGMAHLILLWPWDVLHVYAIAGLALIPLSRISNRGLLLIGVPLALFGREFDTLFHHLASIDGSIGYGDEQAVARQELGAAGHYLALMRNFAQITATEHLANGEMFAWVLYTIGRGMIGVCVGRMAWLVHTERRLPSFRLLLWLCLPAGLLLSGVSEWMQWASGSGRLPQFPAAMFYGELLHRLSSPVLAAGYLAAIVLALQSRFGRQLLAPLATTGRMTFTNYILQSVLILLIFTGIGPGLALAGYVGTVECTLMVLACFGLQVGFSRLWLSYFRTGPLEWVWRYFTYGSAPRMRPPSGGRPSFTTGSGNSRGSTPAR